MRVTAEALDLSGVEGLILDLDGTLHNSGVAAPGAVEMLAWLRARGLPFVLCTQDAEHGETRTAERLRAAGLDARPEDIVSGGAALVAFLKARYRGAPIEAIATERQAQYFVDRGIRLAAPGEKAAALLLLSYNGFSGADLDRACQAIWSGADFLTLAFDRSFRMPHGLIPGLGPFVKAVEHVTRKRARALGKPSREIAAAALAKLGTKPQSTLVVGDTLDADIRMGKNIGARTILTLSGTTSLADLKRARASERPDWAIDDVSVLFEAMRARF
jgi:HAD superfamily hydrolase (TIGR01450 family)